MTGKSPTDAAAAERWKRVCAALDAVLAVPPAQRAEVLQSYCGADAELCAEVEALLRAEAQVGEQLERGVAQWAASMIEALPAESAEELLHGQEVGRWRLLEELGRGGMGTVWRAERADGVFEQRAAVKLLKRGLDSDAILKRFLAERQILAHLAHPNIARVIDGGVAANGRPFFAMELVEGGPIDRWCDMKRLTVRERLRLFLEVVDAVQHAHRQLVVHRDLKPNNILVTPAGEVKLLDFGIAKLLDGERGSASSDTLTRLGYRMLTPEYAAPEQMRGDAVTTATDVYALGVLLYELLTGQRPPPDREQADGAGDVAANGERRSVPRPSSQVAAGAGALRRTGDERLARALRGDLDTIVLKAMHPEPARRYGSVEALGIDVRRHLQGRPVYARPDSAWYRLRKFTIRNRVGVTAAALVLVSLAGGLFATAWQARIAQQRAAEAEREAWRADQARRFLESLFQGGNPSEWRGKEVTARDLLEAGVTRIDEELADDPGLHAAMRATIGEAFLALGQPERAEPLIRSSLEQARKVHGDRHEDYASSLYQWGHLLYVQGKHKQAEQAIATAADIMRDTIGDHDNTIYAIRSLGVIRDTAGDRKQAIALTRESLDMGRRLHGSVHKQVADSARSLALLYVHEERYDEAAPLLRQSRAIVRKLYGERSAQFAHELNIQALLDSGKGDNAAAVQGYSRAVDLFRQAGSEAELKDALGNLGGALCSRGQYPQGIRALEESLEMVRKRVAPGHPDLATPMNNLASCQQRAGQDRQAELLFRETLALWEKVNPEHEYALATALSLADSLLKQGKEDEAGKLVQRTQARLEARHGVGSREAARALRIRATLLRRRGDSQGALALQRSALAAYTASLGPEHAITQSASADVAGTELELGQVESAVKRLTAAIDVLRASGGEGSSSYLRARLLLGRALTVQNKLASAEEVLRSVRQGYRALSGFAGLSAVEAEVYLAVCLARAGKNDEARILFEHAHPILAERKLENPAAARYAAQVKAALASGDPVPVR